MIDAAMTGGAIGAKAGTLVLMCGGNPEILKILEPYFKCYTK